MEIRSFQGSAWYRVELGPGADLFGSLRDFLNKEGLREAYVVYCIGSLDRVVLAYPKTPTVPPEIERFTLEGLFEINVIAGELRRQGERDQGTPPRLGHPGRHRSERRSHQ
jgi:predicted DNA-binding protein with PD1-like motif